MLQKRVIAALLLVLGLAGNGFCAGSGAYRLEVPDAEAMGKGSAFVAQASNPSAVYYNPAGITQLKSKLAASLGTAIILPINKYTNTIGETTNRKSQTFVIPSGYVVSNLGLEKAAVGFGSTSYWGLGTHWSEDSFSKYVATKSDLRADSLMVVGAYEMSDNWSFGASADYIATYVNKKKKLIQPGGLDGDFQLKGKDTNSWGYRLSALYKLNTRHQFGLMYRSQVRVKYKGKAYLDGLNNLGSNYQGIFGGTSYETNVTSVSTFPQSWVLGYCFKPDEKWSFEADLEWVDWSVVQQEKIEFVSETNAVRLSVLNAGNPAPKDWHSALSFCLGGEYKLSEKWRLRGGYFFHKTPVPSANFDTALPDSSSNSITTGIGYSINKNVTLDLAYAGMFFDKRKILNTIGSSSGANVNGEYEQFTNIYLATLSFKY